MIIFKFLQILYSLTDSRLGVYGAQVSFHHEEKTYGIHELSPIVTQGNNEKKSTNIKESNTCSDTRPIVFLRLKCLIFIVLFCLDKSCKSVISNK